MLGRTRLAGLILIGSIVLAGCNGRSQSAILPKVVPAESLKSTDIWPHTSGAIVPGRNYVYCGSFALAWNTLADKYGTHGQIRLTGNPALAAALNQRQFTADAVPADSVLIEAGLWGPNTEAQLHRELARRFPGASIAGLTGSIGNPYLYAHLERSLPFEFRFTRLKPRQFPAGAGTTVQFFGIDSTTEVVWEVGEQVEVLWYRGEADFGVVLKPTGVADEIVIARMPRPETLQAAIKAVTPASPEPSARELWMGEVLAVPVVQCGAQRSYDELCHLPAVDSPALQPGLMVASQTIRFRLDETGAALESEGDGAIAAAVPEKPRQFICDGPFLLMLRTARDRPPYLAIWIENTELLARE
ncbi:MAG: hypothetical protein K1X74_08115 [Pirellulales bacterium]|nr:hypothetical protein [Pirellulales bacterium]